MAVSGDVEGVEGFASVGLLDGAGIAIGEVVSFYGNGFAGLEEDVSLGSVEGGADDADAKDDDGEVDDVAAVAGSVGGDEVQEGEGVWFAATVADSRTSQPFLEDACGHEGE